MKFYNIQNLFLTTLFLIFIAFNAESQCLNADFETGDFIGWDLDYANIELEYEIVMGIPFPIGPATTNWQGTSDIGAQNGNTGNHAIMGPGAGTDPNTGGAITRTYPGGGQYSMRLGDEVIEALDPLSMLSGNISYLSYASQAKASYTFTVTPNTDIFRYHYAVVLQDPGHSTNEQPFLSIKLTVDGEEIDCGKYYQAASGSAQGYSTYNGHSSGEPIRYKDWETMSVILTSFVGQTATIEFITSDCLPAGHFGYAYIDAECGSFDDLENQTIDCSNPLTTIVGPEGATSYSWDGPGIVGADDEQSVQVNAAGTYTVNVVPPQGPDCAYDVTVEVTEVSGSVTGEIIASEDVICVGESIDFEMEYTTDEDVTVEGLSWDFGDGGTGTGASTSHTFNQSGVYTVRGTVETADGECDGNFIYTVTVVGDIDIDFSYELDCAGTVSFTNTSTDEDGNLVTSGLTWDFGDGTTSVDNNPSHTYTSAGSYQVTLGTGGEIDCASDKVVTIEVEEPNLIADFTASDVCLGDGPLQFTDLSTANQGTIITDWTWDFGDGNTSTDQNPTHTFADGENYTVTLTVTDDQGCSSTYALEVFYKEIPSPTIYADVLEGCDPLTVVFTDNSGVTNGNCVWDFGDGNTSNACGATSHTYAEVGDYTVTLTVSSEYGCEATVTENNYIHVYPSVTANFTADPSETVIPMTTVSFTNNSSNADDFIWNFGDDSEVTDGVNPVHTYADDTDGKYTVTLYANNGYCADSVQKVITIRFPGPVYELPNIFTPNGDGENDAFKFVYQQNIKEFKEIYIINRWGNTVYESDDINFSWNGKNNSGADCSEGVYFYVLRMMDYEDNEIEENGFVHLVRDK